ncbi:hypothetical protein [Tuwongella immobilis]|nr:hypothetical protein [Tuwongella immobilis]
MGPNLARVARSVQRSLLLTGVLALTSTGALYAQQAAESAPVKPRAQLLAPRPAASSQPTESQRLEVGAPRGYISRGQSPDALPPIILPDGPLPSATAAAPVSHDRSTMPLTPPAEPISFLPPSSPASTVLLPPTGEPYTPSPNAKSTTPYNPQTASAQPSNGPSTHSSAASSGSSVLPPLPPQRRMVNPPKAQKAGWTNFLGMRILGKPTPKPIAQTAILPKSPYGNASQSGYPGMSANPTQMPTSTGITPASGLSTAAQASLTVPTPGLLPPTGAPMMPPTGAPLMPPTGAPMPRSLAAAESPMGLPGASMPGGPTMVSNKPAYRWYGYGAPTPGANPYAPTGVYSPPPTDWFSKSGATPGAIPVTLPDASVAMQSAVPMGGYPSMTEPPLARATPADGRLLVPGAANAPMTDSMAASQAMNRQSVAFPNAVAPNANSGTTSGMPAVVALQPQPATGYVARGVAPDREPAQEMSVPEMATTRIRDLRDARIDNLMVMARGEKHLLIQVTIPQASEANAIADRISGIPELTQYRIDFEIRVRQR